LRRAMGRNDGGCYPVRTMIFRFGLFELDTESEQLLKTGRTVRIQPQPYKLLSLLLAQAGKVVPRDDIRAALWPAETFVDYDQGVNFAMKQIREALGDDAEHPVYVQTVPKRGYRFIAPVEERARGASEATQLNRPRTDLTLTLQKVLWSNIADLRLAEAERVKRRRTMRVAALWGGIALAIAAIAAVAVLWLR
jgi:DNA-binding winged helix-turn-helix (wHTH) protein